MSDYLIRTNVEDEGWHNEGIFDEKGAIDFIESFTAAAQKAEESGVTAEFRIFCLYSDSPTPVELNAQYRPSTGKIAFFVGTSYDVTRRVEFSIRAPYSGEYGAVEFSTHAPYSTPSSFEQLWLSGRKNRSLP